MFFLEEHLCRPMHVKSNPLLCFAGLARKEDFSYVTYYCPHCSALNRPKQLDDRVSGSNSPHLSSSTSASDVEVTKNVVGSVVQRTSPTSGPLSPVDAAARTTESNIVASDGPVS